MAWQARSGDRPSLEGGCDPLPLPPAASLGRQTGREREDLTDPAGQILVLGKGGRDDDPAAHRAAGEVERPGPGPRECSVRGVGPTRTITSSPITDLSAAHLWDASCVAVLDAIEWKYVQRGKTVGITGLNAPSADLHGKLTGELTGSH